MVPIALILLAIVILFSVAVVVSNPVPVTLSIFGAQIPVQTPAVYFTGAAAMLVTIVALLLLRTGYRRSVAQRKELRTLKKEAKARGARGGDATTAVPTGVAKPVDTGTTTPHAGGTPAPKGGAEPSSSPTAAQGSSTSAERQAWLAQADEITGDDPKR